MGVQIMTPRQFLKLLRSPPSSVDTIAGNLAVLGAILHTGVRHGWSPQSSLHGHPHLAQVILEARQVKP